MNIKNAGISRFDIDAFRGKYDFLSNMIVSPYVEFPFSGMDIAEILLPILLVYEAYRRTKGVLISNADK